MRLTDILKNIDFQTKDNISNIEITNLSFNASKTLPSSLHFCLNGSKVDGHNYAALAVNNGAKAIVVEKLIDVKVPQILVSNARKAFAVASGNFYGNPAQKLHIIGVSGTNGKTSTTYILRSILKAAGYRVGVIGTIGVLIDNEKTEALMTTPDPSELHKIFSQMVKQNIEYVVMEVSAHAIALNKLEGVVFDVGILTNITQDHLDFFKTFSHYAHTKLSFASKHFCKNVVVNADDALLKTLLVSENADFCSSYGLLNANCYPNEFQLLNDGIVFNVTLNGNNVICNTKLIGKFNLYNILGCVQAAKILGISSNAIQKGINEVDVIPGRFNVHKLNNGSIAIIDYAHTPDGLQKILQSAKEICAGRVFCVFGCGGNRDKEKRPIMGRISGELADFSVLTSDNPRFENPIAIIKDIEQGIKEVTSNYISIPNRKKAIEKCLSLCGPKDVVVIAGKGAENYFEIQGKKLPYSDLEVIKSIK